MTKYDWFLIVSLAILIPLVVIITISDNRSKNEWRRHPPFIAVNKSANRIFSRYSVEWENSVGKRQAFSHTPEDFDSINIGDTRRNVYEVTK